MASEYEELKQWLEETAEEPLETMAAFFDRRIGDYEAHMAFCAEHYRRLAQLVPEGTKTLLDLGCGSGLELDQIFLRFPRLEVTGVDLSEEMLSLLSKKHGDKTLTLVQADYFAWDMGEEQFDCVLSFESFHHFPLEKKAELFGKIYRCLKPGGVFLEGDYIASTQEIEDLTFRELARRRERDKIPADVFVHFDTPLTIPHELEAMRLGGFPDPKVVDMPPGNDHTPLIQAKKPAAN